MAANPGVILVAERQVEEISASPPSQDLAERSAQPRTEERRGVLQPAIAAD